MDRAKSIPRPLVRTNQWFIVIAVIATWLTNQYWILALPLATGLTGIVFGVNPIMRLAKLFLRKPANQYIPEDRDQQKFNQIIAVACLGLGLIGYIIHFKIMAYGFTIMVALAAFIAILGFCVGCFIRYQWLQYRHRHKMKLS